MKLINQKWQVTGKPEFITLDGITYGIQPAYGYTECTTYVMNNGIDANGYYVTGSLNNHPSAWECKDIWNALMGDEYKAYLATAYGSHTACSSNSDCKYSVTENFPTYCEFRDEKGTGSNTIRWYTNDATNYGKIILNP